MHLSFPDSHRRQRVSGDTWRVQLLPLQARPTCGCSASRHALTPGLDALVVSILDAILGRLEAALRRGLLEDYDLWVREQKAAQRAAAAAAIETQP